jgi:hypothetical protein
MQILTYIGRRLIFVGPQLDRHPARHFPSPETHSRRPGGDDARPVRDGRRPRPAARRTRPRPLHRRAVRHLSLARAALGPRNLLADDDAGDVGPRAALSGDAGTGDPFAAARARHRPAARRRRRPQQGRHRPQVRRLLRAGGRRPAGFLVRPCADLRVLHDAWHGPGASRPHRLHHYPAARRHRFAPHRQPDQRQLAGAQAMRPDISSCRC